MFLIEEYRSTTDADDPDASGGAVAGVGQGAVRYLGALALPMDEVVFQLFDAASRDVLMAALATAGVRVNRISEVRDFGLAAAMHGEIADASAGPEPVAAPIRRAERGGQGGWNG